LCERDALARSLALSWAITPFVVPFDLLEPQNTIETALKFLVKQGRVRSGSTVVIIGLIMGGEEIVDAVQMRVI
jgi:pyruvate kinase